MSDDDPIGTRPDVDKDKDSARLLLLHGKAFLTKNDYINALDAFNKAQELDPDNMAIYEGLAYASNRLGDYTYSRKYAEEAISKGLNSAMIYNVLGLALESNQYKEYEYAADSFTKAINIVPSSNPNDSSILLPEMSDSTKANFFANRASALYHLKDYDKALADIDKALSMNPNNYTALLYKAKIYVDLKDGKALDAIKKVLQVNPKDPTANKMASKLTGIQISDQDSSMSLTMFEAPSIPKETFADIAGMSKLKDTIKQAIIYPLLNPELAKEYNVVAGGGILLYGPPGCGKTFTIKAAAGEAKVNFINAKIPDLLDHWFGNSEKNIHNLFVLARNNAPCILFFDEIDALGGQRELTGVNVTMRVLVNTILTELDGASSYNANILIVGATNAPWTVDNAIKRPGRLGNLIYIPAPDSTTRKELFKLYLKGRPVDNGLDLDKLSKLTDLCNCSDIAAICTEAAKIPWFEAVNTGKKRNISQMDLLQAISNHKKSLPEWYESSEKTIGKSGDTELYKDLIEAVNEYDKSKGSGSASSYA